MTNDQKIQLQVIGAYQKAALTDEQMEFASDLTKDTISFSDPGTGKTHTLIAGLLMLQQYYKYPGSRINCMSYTKAATGEIAARYEKIAKQLRISDKVVFNTFHSMALKILRQAFHDIDIGDTPISDKISNMAGYMNALGMDTTDKNYVKKVILAIEKLNSALVFHKQNVTSRYDFVDLNMSFEDFQELRKRWVLRGITLNHIEQGEIPLYTLYALKRYPEITNEWKGKFKVMVIDEFQDLTLLHLNILSFISETLIVIGDMKQQIYYFNGACPQIVDEYLRMRPNARICNLSKSFRCSQEIADFATNVYTPNDPSIKAFTGAKTGGSVNLVSRKSLNWKDIAANINADIKAHTISKARDIMFLYRNNSSAIPIVDELYKQHIPFRCPNLMTIMNMPIFNDLTKWALLAWNPTDVKCATDALRTLDEFKYRPYNEELAPISCMKGTGKSFLEMNYAWNDGMQNIISILKQVRTMIIGGTDAFGNKAEPESAWKVYSKLFPIYDIAIIKKQYWKLDNPPDFYFNLIGPICTSKTFPELYGQELDKVRVNERNISGQMGIRCYTMHSSKGLEADDVYILDADNIIFPNIKKLQKKVEACCYFDAACEVRNERNLLYVAITRAKDNVYISSSQEDNMTKLITDPLNSEFKDLDDIYMSTDTNYSDSEAYFKLLNM